MARAALVFVLGWALAGCGGTDTASNGVTDATTAGADEKTASDASDPTMDAEASDNLACLDIARWLTEALTVISPDNDMIQRDPSGYAEEIEDLVAAGDVIAERYPHRPMLAGRISMTTSEMETLAAKTDAGHSLGELVVQVVKVNTQQQALATECLAIQGN